MNKAMKIIGQKINYNNLLKDVCIFRICDLAGNRSRMFRYHGSRFRLLAKRRSSFRFPTHLRCCWVTVISLRSIRCDPGESKLESPDPKCAHLCNQTILDLRLYPFYTHDCDLLHNHHQLL